MPPVMMTAVMPSAMMPKDAKLRVMLEKLSAVPKLGSQDGHVGHQQRSSATVTQKAWLARMRCRTVCSLIFATSAMTA